jgi:hypothetical protein
MRNTTLVLSACIAALALSACGKSPGERAAEAAIEKATGQKATVDAKTGEVVIKSEKGDVAIHAGESASLPKTFPSDVYLPAEYKVESVMEMPGAIVVQLDAKGEIGPMFDAAGKKMAAEGWKQALSMQQSNDQQMAMFEKDKRTATLSLVDDEAPGVKLNVQVQTQQ